MIKQVFIKQPKVLPIYLEYKTSLASSLTPLEQYDYAVRYLHREFVNTIIDEVGIDPITLDLPSLDEFRGMVKEEPIYYKYPPTTVEGTLYYIQQDLYIAEL